MTAPTTASHTITVTTPDGEKHAVDQAATFTLDKVGKFRRVDQPTTASLEDWSICAWCGDKPFGGGEWDAPICPDCEAVDQLGNSYFGSDDE